ncbi:MAG: heme ABC exporter ATP-binding protein CcmA [Anaerolineae bacterium]|nr:heme ABC exporter ATP-binding protein CcmA [Anaerolineae bacterium]
MLDRDSSAVPLLSVQRLSKQFGVHWALREVSFDVGAGDVVTLFGPNGAGKTTLVRLVATLGKPTSGVIVLDGRPLKASAASVRQGIGFVSHQPLLYPDLTAHENLTFFARLYGLTESRPRIDALLGRVGLAHRADDPVRQYSRGMQQRLSLARALLHDPRLLLLDEPYTGLDPVATDWLNRLLAELSQQGHTILMTSHDLQGGAALASRVLILAGGRLVFAADAASLAPGELAAAYLAAGRVATEGARDAGMTADGLRGAP